MSFSLLTFLVFSAQVRLGACVLYYYWVDNSCAGKIDGVVKDAVLMAAGASFRLSNHADQNQQEIFDLFFQAEYTEQAAFTKVQNYMGGIGSFRPTLDQPSSDVRIYCDGDVLNTAGGRWTLVPDIAEDPIKNSQRVFGQTQEWEDKYNAVGRATDTIGCLDGETLAETYYTLRTPAGTVANQNPVRSVITLCDRILGDQQGRGLPGKTFFEINPGAELAEAPTADAWESLTSVIMLHELTHTRRFNTTDVKLTHLPKNSKGQYETAVGYELVVNEVQNSVDALKNADTYALYGLFTRLADFNYRVADLGEHDDEDRTDGKLVYDAGLQPPDQRLGQIAEILPNH